MKIETEERFWSLDQRMKVKRVMKGWREKVKSDEKMERKGGVMKRWREQIRSDGSRR